jgi:hypothetical protein
LRSGLALASVLLGRRFMALDPMARAETLALRGDIRHIHDPVIIRAGD